MAVKVNQPEVSTTAKCTASDNGMLYKSREDAPDSNISPIEPPWGGEDGVEDDESWNGKRGQNKNNTTGVSGTVTIVKK